MNVRQKAEEAIVNILSQSMTIGSSTDDSMRPDAIYVFCAASNSSYWNMPGDRIHDCVVEVVNRAKTYSPKTQKAVSDRLDMAADLIKNAPLPSGIYQIANIDTNYNDDQERKSVLGIVFVEVQIIDNA